MDITFASLITPAGTVIAGGIITTLVQLIKTTFPPIDAKISGAIQAFTLSAGLYVLAGVAIGVGSLDAGLGIFMAWLACATSAVGIKAGADHIAAQR